MDIKKEKDLNVIEERKLDIIIDKITLNLINIKKLKFSKEKLKDDNNINETKYEYFIKSTKNDYIIIEFDITTNIEWLLKAKTKFTIYFDIFSKYTEREIEENINQVTYFVATNYSLLIGTLTKFMDITPWILPPFADIIKKKINK